MHLLCRIHHSFLSFFYIYSVIGFYFNLYIVICLQFIYLYGIAIHYTCN